MSPDSTPERARLGWLLDGTGSPALGPVELTWQGDLLLAITEVAAEAPLAPGTRDLRACTGLPCLVDAHVHLAMEATADPARREAQLESTYEDRLPVMARHVAAHAAHGIAAVRDGGDYGGFALRFRDAPDAEVGGRPPVLCLCAGRAFRAEGRYGKLIGRPPAPGQSLAEAVAAERDPVDLVKLAQSGVNSLRTFGRPTAPQWSTEALRAAVAAAAARGLPVMVHANGAEPVARARDAGVASVEHGYFASAEVLAGFAERGVTWVPTLAPMHAYAESPLADGVQRDVARRTLEHQLEQVRRGLALGVPIAAGSDAGSPGVHHGAGLWLELRLLAEAGVPAPELVRIATADGARLLRAEDRAGALRPAGRASFLAVIGSPAGLFASDSPRIAAICLGGRDFPPTDPIDTPGGPVIIRPPGGRGIP